MDANVAGLLAAVQALGRIVGDSSPQIAERIRRMADRFDLDARSAPDAEAARLAADILRGMVTTLPS